MHKKHKGCLIIVIIILLSCFLFITYKSKTKIEENKGGLDISYYRIKEILNNNISDRTILVLNDAVFVGNSKKELENGYYDLKISKDNKCLEIYINKVWKEFDEKLYQDEYINQVVISLLKIYELNEKTYKDLLYDYILEGYLFTKQKLDTKIESVDKLEIGDVDVKRKIMNNQLVLIINKEVNI